MRKMTGYDIRFDDHYLRYDICIYAGPGQFMATQDGRLLLVKEGDGPAKPIRAIARQLTMSFSPKPHGPHSRKDIANALWHELRPAFHAERRELGLMALDKPARPP
jgi:hypothetical protein